MISFPGERSGPFADVGRISVAEYHNMIRASVFDTPEKERHELIEGWILPKAKQSPAHCHACQVLTHFFWDRQLPEDWMYSGIVTLPTADSHPEPDGQIVRERWVEEVDWPRPDESTLVIEVSDVTLSFDQTIKKRVYGRSSIPIYWIVNIPDRQVELYTDPTGPTDPPENAGYRSRHDYHEADSVPVVIGGQQVAMIPVANLLPRV
jgi:Putative restriction endonuclease